MKFKAYDKVEVHGNKEAIILNHVERNLYDVRLWSGFRHVGDIIVEEQNIKLITESEE